MQRDEELLYRNADKEGMDDKRRLGEALQQRE